VPTEPPASSNGTVTPSGQYFDRTPAVASSRRTTWLNLPGVSAELATDRGVFAGDGIDPGTRYLLLERSGHLTVPPDAHLLDLGCGYGPIAIAMASWTSSATGSGEPTRPTVWAVDVNDRALDLCRDNVAAAGLAGRVRVVRPEDVPDEVRFAEIWSNPPIRVGKGALHSMLDQWLSRLTDDGVAWLVVHKHLGSDSLVRWLGGQGYRAERHSSRMGYRLLKVGRA
jgi:16S rRNA G1207 methylase RsmC